MCLTGLALLAACSKRGEPPPEPAGDGGATDAARDQAGDTARLTPCNGTCTGICRGLCVGVCSERNQDGECVAPCAGTCIGSCEGTCPRGTTARPDAGAAARPDAGVDGRVERPAPAPDGGAEPDSGPPPAYGTWTDRTRASTASWPPLAQTGAMVFDNRRLRAVMFGGFRERSNNTWEWDGRTGTWTLMQQLGGARPSRRTGHALVFDSVRGRVILHGGIDDSGASNNETWEWDGAREVWTQKAPGPTPSRWGHAMVFDESTGRVVLFGGAHRHPMLGDGELLDTWEYDPAADKWVNWTYPLPGVWPRPRKGHAMAYDPSRSVTVMYGGEVSNLGLASDLWEWSGTYRAWRERTPPTPPPGWPGPRALATLAYVGNGQMVLLGLESPAFLRWSAGANEWQSLTPPAPAAFPRPRMNALAAWDTFQNALVVVGGPVPLGRDVLTDTWQWRP